MSQSRAPKLEDGERVYEEYILDVRVVKYVPEDGEEPHYRFEAPQHTEMTFADPEKATLYADVYFDVNGFEEDGTGERGIPPEIVVAGKDTMAAYLLTQPYADGQWVASFYGKTPGKIEKYASIVRDRAEEIRTKAHDQGHA